MEKSNIGYKISIFLVILLSPPLFFLQTYLFPDLFTCPYLAMTSTPCPFCGTTHSLHFLLNFQILTSLHENFFGVLSLISYFIFLISSVISFFIKERKVFLFQIGVLIFVLCFNVIGYLLLSYLF